MNARRNITSSNAARARARRQHGGRNGRVVATLTTAALAALLAIAPSAAFASDGPVDPGAAAAQAPATDAPPADPADAAAADPAADAAGTADPKPDPKPDPQSDSGSEATDAGPEPATEPAPEPAPAPEPSTANTSTADAGTTASSPPASRPRTFMAAVLGPVVNALAVACVGDPAPDPSGFEIDGNTCVQGVGLDWDTTGLSVEDGFDDSTGFSGGSSENDNPTSWSIGGSPNGKSDIGTAWAYSHVSGGQVYGFFAITNNSTSGGTSQYDVEYNQLSPVTGGSGKPVPNRSPGDLLFRFSSTGSDPIVFTDAKKYTLTSSPSWSNGNCFTVSGTTGGWCGIPKPAGAFAQQTNADGTFFEGAINISLLFGAGNCSGSFGSTQIRSVTGNSFATSALKDYVTPMPVTTPSTCGRIVINKQDSGNTPLAGATFSVSPNPDPTLPNGTPYSITDNDSKDKNPADGVIEISPVDPNESYTVTETAAPAGYFLASPAAIGPVLVGPSQTQSFTFHDPKKWKALTATKTAQPTYTASYGWSVVKEISANGANGWQAATTQGSPLDKHAPANDPNAANLYYRVAVTEGARTTSAYKVSGSISVTNPNDAAVTADISDTLPGASCLVDGQATLHVAVPAGGPTAYPYVCTFPGTPGDLSGTNTAHVAWDRSDYPQVQADIDAAGSYQIDPTAPYAFGAETTAVNKTVTVTDDHHTFPGGWTITWNPNDGVVNTSPVYSSTVEVTPGSCSAVLANTATLTGDDNQVVGQDSAYGRVCEGVDLTITRIDGRGFTRTYPWAVQKSTTTPKVTVVDGKATAHYEVTVKALDGIDSDWVMTGTIKVKNPNSFEAVSVTALPVTYSGGGVCAATGPFPAAIPAGQTVEFPYTCNFGGVQPAYDGTVSARVEWDAATAATPNDHTTSDLAITEADWDKTLVNATAVLHDDNTTPGDDSDDTTWNLDWATVHAMPGHQQVVPFDIDIPNLPDGGTCGDRVNTVAVIGDGGASLDADKNVANNSATVQVCNPLGLSVATTAVGDFTRTYPWTIEKFIDGDKTSQTVNIDAYGHTFDYKVKATPGTPTDSAWVVAGTITVTNDNTDGAIDPISLTSVSELPAVGAPGVCTVTPPSALPLAIPANGHVDVAFSCTFASQPTKPYAGNATASVTWGDSGMASSLPKPITWHAPTEIDKTIAVYDNKVDNIADPVLLGNAVWNAEGTPTVFDYELELTVPEETAGSCAPDFVNTAWLGGNGINPTELQDSTTARICVNPGTWTVAKANLAGDGPMPVDTDVTYRLTAHKTGGVDPKDVVVSDDLSDLAPYLDGDPTFTAPAGSTVSYDAGTHVLTWTIGQLGATDAKLDFTVHVADDAYGADLPNLVTSPGSTNCPNAEVAAEVDVCTTDNATPSYTLVKASSVAEGGQVLPPYLGDPGTTVTYTLTVHNDSDAPINPTTLPGATVTDDLSDVLDDATFVDGSIDPGGQAVLDAGAKKLTWTLPVIPAGGTAVLTYQVVVNAGAWDETLTNHAIAGDGGRCVETARAAIDGVVAEGGVETSCTTTAVTPKTTRISVLKVDSETDEPLAGAEFTLLHGEDAIATAVSGEDGKAVFDIDLLPGTFTVKETKAPENYSLPLDGADTVTIVVDEENFVAGGVMEPITFRDPANGQIAIVSKEHYERDPVTDAWVLSDGAVDFGQEIRYVVHVKATGRKLFHNATVTDYVPGYNPVDTTSTGKGVLEVGTSTCSGDLQCDVTEDLTSGLITWKLRTGEVAGDVRGDAVGAVEFVVRMPELPADPAFDDAGIYSQKLWNVGYLDWDQLDVTETPQLADRVARAFAVAQTHHHLTSNEVIDEARAIEAAPPAVVPEPPSGETPAELPSTGGPARWLLLLGLGLAAAGAVVVAGERRTRRRS